MRTFLLLLLLLLPVAGTAQPSAEEAIKAAQNGGITQTAGPIDTTVTTAEDDAVLDAIKLQDDLNRRLDAYNKSKFMKGEEFVICILLLSFAVVVFLAEVLLFLKGKLDSQQIIKVLLVTLIIFSVLFLITAGYDNNQIGPAVGLLGTIAGYLLGRSSASPNSKSESNN